MALLRNREVELLSKTDGEDASPNYTVMYKDGTRENVRLDELQLTEDEHKNIAKQHGERTLGNVSIVKDKDLQDIRDSQDRKKIEERQKNQPQNRDVEVSKIKVDSGEVLEKSNPNIKAKK